MATFMTLSENFIPPSVSVMRKVAGLGGILSSENFQLYEPLVGITLIMVVDFFIEQHQFLVVWQRCVWQAKPSLALTSGSLKGLLLSLLCWPIPSRQDATSETEEI